MVYVCEHNSDGAMGIVINKLVEQFIVENVLHKLKIVPTNRDPAIRLNESVFSGGTLAGNRGLSCIRRQRVSDPVSAFRRKR
ncbi:MAG: hypothetical protein GPOALKHO_001875 [Sodalis sp.]|nr:MAG: hypothetical protein GPOALKHO_001875 [Sodalis sp.]